MTQEAPVDIRQEGTKTVLDVHTDNIDFRNAETLKGFLTDQVQQHGHKFLVFNLEHVHFMDSSGLSVLLCGKRVTEEAGGTFSICGLQGYVNNLVNLTNLNKTIAVYPSASEATSL